MVLIGKLRAGVCRHRALLYKYCADRIGYGMPDMYSTRHRHRMSSITREMGLGSLKGGVGRGPMIGVIGES